MANPHRRIEQILFYYLFPQLDSATGLCHVLEQPTREILRGEEVKAIESPTVKKLVGIIRQSKLLQLWLSRLYKVPFSPPVYQAKLRKPGPLCHYVSQYVPLDIVAAQARREVSLLQTLEVALSLRMEEALTSSSPSLFLEMYKRGIVNRVDAQLMAIEALLTHNAKMLTALALEVLEPAYLLGLLWVDTTNGDNPISKVTLLEASSYWNLPLPIPTVNSWTTWDQLVKYIEMAHPNTDDMLGKMGRLFIAYLSDDLNRDLSDLEEIIDYTCWAQVKPNLPEDVSAHLEANTIPKQRLEQLLSLSSYYLNWTSE